MKATRTEGDGKILTGVRRAFARQRQLGLGVGNAYPKRLRSLAISALKAGHLSGAVAAAAGVSPQSLWNWGHQVRKQMTPPAVELKLIKEATGEVNAAAAPEVMAQIHFRTGAVMDIPVFALSASLLAALNGGVT